MKSKSRNTEKHSDKKTPAAKTVPKCKAVKSKSRSVAKSGWRSQRGGEEPNSFSVFEDNPFIEGIYDWMDSAEGQLSMEVDDCVNELLSEVEVDAKERKILWPDGARLSISESVKRIHGGYSQYPLDEIEDSVICWLEGGYTPESYTTEQLEELDILVEDWLSEYLNRPALDLRQCFQERRTRDS